MHAYAYEYMHLWIYPPGMPWCKKILPCMSQAFKNMLPKEASIKGLCHQDVNLVLVDKAQIRFIG